MAKSIIVYGVKGGKTRFAKRIAEHFGLKLAKKEFSGKKDTGILCDGFLYFTREPEAPKGFYAAHSRSFQTVADEINASIPLTDWQSGPPPMVGEWNASRWSQSENRMWWHGASWSESYQPDQSEWRRNRSAKTLNPGGVSNLEIKWRGLSEEPILVTP